MRALTASARIDVEQLPDLADVAHFADGIPVLPGVYDTAVEAFGFDELNVIVPVHWRPFSSSGQRQRAS